MKKMFLLICITMFLCISCQNNLETPIHEQYKSEVAMNIAIMKENGLFDSLLFSRNVENSEEMKKVTEFINNTDAVLDEIRLEENGEEQIKIIEALFTGGTTEEFAESLALLDADKANEFSVMMDETTVNIKPLSRNILSNNSIINLSYYTPQLSRALYSDSLTWASVGLYTGFCASTIAGFCLMSCGGLWTRAIGLVATTAGIGSMTYQIGKWSQCTDLINFVKSLVGKDLATATKILNSDNGMKILTIAGETAGTAFICSRTVVGKSLIAFAISNYNSFIHKILDVLPKGINYTICGIPLAIIVLDSK